MSDTSALLRQALAFHQSGRLTDAERTYREILAYAPQHGEALHGLGIAAYQKGELADADRLIAQALAIMPGNPQALSNRGNVLLALQRPGEALACYDRALTIKPDLALTLYNRGNTLTQLQRWDEAIASYDRALAITPDSPDAFYNRGNALMALKRFPEALTSYDRALATGPASAETLSNRGAVLLELERPGEALASFEQALAIRPDFVEVLYNRSNALMALGQPERALVSFDRTLGLRPTFAEAWCNRGNALLELKRLNDALASYDRSLSLKPDFAEALCSRGNVLIELRRLDEALADLTRAATVKPDYAEAHWNESRCRLLMGDFRRGWEKSEWRWQIKPQKDQRRGFMQPLWLGHEDVAGKTILLHAEGGYGDVIQFSRYAPLLAESGARVVLEVQPALKSLLAGLGGVSEVAAVGDPLPPFDMQCPVLSLPLVFKTTLATIPAQTPYLHATPEALAKWRAKLGHRGELRVGLAWSGRSDYKNDRHRSMAPERLTPLLDVPVRFFSLKKDYRAEDRAWLAAHPQVRDFADELHDFAETAALASCMDLVITVDTSIAHLAGALGQPVWIMLSCLSLDRRWMLERSDSPWYPTARLYRQREIDAWDDVIVRVAHDLGALARAPQ